MMQKIWSTPATATRRATLVASALVTALAAALVVLASPLAAQRTWPERGPVPIFGVELGKGLYRPLATPNGVLNFALPTSTVTASAWLPLTRRVALTAELPVSHMSERTGTSQSDATVVGDPWIGLETKVGRDWTWVIGVRPGIVADKGGVADTLARTNGIAADYDHYEAWRPGYRTLRTTAHYDHEFARGLFVGSLAGGSVAWPTGPAKPAPYNENEQFSWFQKEEEEGNGVDAYVLYGIRAGYRDPGITVSVAFIGRAYPTAHGPLTEPTVHQLAVAVGAASGRVRPTAELRVYRDRYLQPRTTAVVSVGVKVWR